MLAENHSDLVKYNFRFALSCKLKKQGVGHAHEVKQYQLHFPITYPFWLYYLKSCFEMKFDSSKLALLSSLESLAAT